MIYNYLCYYFARAPVGIWAFFVLDAFQIIVKVQVMLSAYDAGAPLNSRKLGLGYTDISRKVIARRKMILCLVKSLLYSADLLPEGQ